MRRHFLRTLTTPAVLAAQQQAYGHARLVPDAPVQQTLGAEEKSFIAARDSFYLASTGETGWPYVQHRGGPHGFLQVVDDTHLAFPDYNGNRQLISTGNVAADDRVALFLMDYPARERLKIIGHARVVSPDEAVGLAPRLVRPPEAKIERVFLIEIVGFDWNCSKYITPRFTADQVAAAVQPLRDRIAELEKKLAETHRG